MFEPGRDPYRPVRRHQPAALWRGHLHGAFGGVNQLRLAVHVGVEPGALAVIARDQVHAIAGRPEVAPFDALKWRIVDSHWPHLVRTRPYKRFSEKRGFDAGI